MNEPPVPAHPANRCITGIPGFDEILKGGLPYHRFYLVEGEPGVGKTTFGLQFLLEGVRRGGKCMYVTLSETHAELTEVAHSYGWSLADIAIFELSAMDKFIVEEAQNTIFHTSEVELGQVIKVVMEEISKVQPDRLVFDSLSELRLLAQNPFRFRRQLLALKQYFSNAKCTVMVVGDGKTDGADEEVQSLAHGVFHLKQTIPVYGPERRCLHVVKLRGCSFRGGYHDYRIAENGIVVYPRMSMSKTERAPHTSHLSSGIAALDELVGGGLNCGTSTLFMGPPGTGKSTLSACYAAAAAARGEKSFICTFEEKVDLYVERADAMALHLSQWIKNGLVQAERVKPSDLSPGEFSAKIRKNVEERDVRLVVIDSLNGYLNAMPEERGVTVQLHELIAHLAERGVATILILTQQGLIGSMHSTVDITYLADTVIILRYFEVHGAVKQAISVIKRRSGDPERTIREYKLDAGGIHLGQPLIEFQGVLTGVPKFRGGNKDIITRQDG